jgi:thiosulfate/3-mercaptopyruvate sulfurtransferase
VTPAKASKKVSFKSSNAKVAKVNSKGVVTGLKAGKATITATSTVNKKVKASIKITVKDEVAGDLVISASELKQKIKDGESLILVDTRGINSSKETAKNAITINWKQISHSELTDGTKSGEAGYARSLSASRMSKKLGALGLGVKDQIILFSDAHGSGGWGDDGRVAWQLIQCGYKNVKIVNGGLTAMKKAGIATQTGPSTPKKKTVNISKVDTTSHDITTEKLIKNYSDYKIIDVRADAEYNGEVLYGETSGGHLKGAIHIRFTDLFNKNGTLKSRTKLNKMFAAAGLKKTDKIVTYCTGGIRSAYMQLILQELGYTKSYNYAESAYRWSNTSSAGTADLWEK